MDVIHLTPQGGASPPDHGGRSRADRGSPCATDQGGHRRSSSSSRATGHGENLEGDSVGAFRTHPETSRGADRGSPCAADHGRHRGIDSACAS